MITVVEDEILTIKKAETIQPLKLQESKRKQFGQFDLIELIADESDIPGTVKATKKQDIFFEGGSEICDEDKEYREDSREGQRLVAAR